ncbi:MAG: aldo/keto reductase [Spirochaetes bacterium GWF1_51_8]|nr:MAG: aldo/keto reductase [Spirochaetes bacterium GWF1_51_8]
MKNKKRVYGSTGIEVSALGFGAGHIGDPNTDESATGLLLNQALDLGITLFDTARGYGVSEERIGRHLSHRRKEFVISTKAGYGIDGVPDWTYDCILAGVERALRVMNTDYLDIVHLHSCPLDVLERGDVARALQKTVSDGKVRAAAYSGENRELAYAVTCGCFAGIQCSVNLCDQRSLEEIIPTAIKNNIGIIAKRPLANSPWRYDERPYGHYCEDYWVRLRKMSLPIDLQEYHEVALRFAVFSKGVSSAIVGSNNIEHIKHNIGLVEKGPLPADVLRGIQDAFRDSDEEWVGLV